MKLNIFPSIIAVALSALIAYGLYSWCQCEEMNMILAIVGFISLILTLGATWGLSYSEPRTSVNIKVLSGTFAGLILIDQIVFSCLKSYAAPLYIVISGILVLLWLIAFYGIIRAMK